jgi:transmembrane sensor
MSATNDQVRQLITQRAADWFVANRAGMTPEQRQSFTDWLKTSPVHVEEYLAIAVIGRDLRRACTLTAHSVDALIERARNDDDSTIESLRPLRDPKTNDGVRRGWRFTVVAMSFALLLTSALVLFYKRTPAPTASLIDEVTTSHYQTGHGQQRSYLLADRSVVHLNTDSGITIRYSKQERSVSLSRGEAVFDVAHESARPFRVTTNAAQIIDVGTRFDVRLTEAATLITVIEGQVEVRSASAGPNSDALHVRAGQQARVTDGGMMFPPASVDAGRATAWLHRQISFDREPLEKVAAEFNRYAMKSIAITTPELRGLRVSGIFTTDDTAAFVAFLRSLEGVQVEETATQIVVSGQSHHKGIR